MKQFNGLLFLLLTLMVSACSVPVNKQEIRTSQVRQEGLVFNMNYQALLKCWDDNAEKAPLNYGNGTFTQLYPEIGRAEIYVTAGLDNYFVLIELKKLSPHRTEVNAYGQGWYGDKYLPMWVEVFERCAK